MLLCQYVTPLEYSVAHGSLYGHIFIYCIIHILYMPSSPIFATMARRNKRQSNTCLIV